MRAKKSMPVMGMVERIEFLQTAAGSVPILYIARQQAKGLFTVMIQDVGASRDAFLEKYMGQYIALHVVRAHGKRPYITTEKQLQILRDADDSWAGMPE